MVKNREKVMEFVNAEYLEHTQTYKEGVARDFIDVYLAEIYRQNKSAQPNPAFEGPIVLSYSQIIHIGLLARLLSGPYVLF